MASAWRWFAFHMALVVFMLTAAAATTVHWESVVGGFLGGGLLIIAFDDLRDAIEKRRKGG